MRPVPIVAGLVVAAGLILALAVFPRALRRAGPPPAPPSQTPRPPVIPAGVPVSRSEGDWERSDNGLALAFVLCPAGSFRMGSGPGGRPGVEGPPPLEVRLTREFWLGKFEVTQAQWKAVTGLTLRRQRAKDPTQPRPVGDGTMREHVGEGPDHPIYFVSHDDATEFCRAFTLTERAAGRLPEGWSYDLPTEAQWEYACRAGTTTATAFGDSLSSLSANFDGTKPVGGAAVGPYLRETTPVGRYPSNAWGLHDTHGNVAEWCRDGYAPVPVGGDDPVAPAAPRRVFRGGGWDMPGAACRSSERYAGGPDGRGSGLGFRVALVPTATAPAFPPASP